MVLPAASALTLTQTAVTTTNNQELQQEVSNAEVKITQATGQGVFIIKYNALIVGNPVIDPRVNTADLPTLQMQFYNAFVQAGYVVGLDPLTGFWSINWANFGPETMSLVYSLRTTLNPTSPDIRTQTENTIKVFFGGLVPVVYVDVAYNGFVADSTYYEFTVIAGQDSDRTDHSSTLRGYLETAGLGFNSGNLTVYLLTP